jgi:hypothetical protein
VCRSESGSLRRLWDEYYEPEMTNHDLMDRKHKEDIGELFCLHLLDHPNAIVTSTNMRIP